MFAAIRSSCITVAQNKSTNSLFSKAKHDRIRSGNYMDGWPLAALRARLRARPEISSESNYVQTLQQQQKVLRMRL